MEDVNSEIRVLQNRSQGSDTAAWRKHVNSHLEAHSTLNAISPVRVRQKREFWERFLSFSSHTPHPGKTFFVSLTRNLYPVRVRVSKKETFLRKISTRPGKRFFQKGEKISPFGKSDKISIRDPPEKIFFDGKRRDLLSFFQRTSSSS